MTNKKYGNIWSATFNGIKDLFKKSPRIGRLADDLRLDGKVCMVTGANSGLGFAVATQLAQRGAHVIMACRSGIPESGEKVKALSQSDKVEMLPVDLSDLESVHRLCNTLKEHKIKLDLLVSNAAIVPRKSRKTVQGLEEMFQVNYLAKFVMINRLLEDGTIPKNPEENSGQISRIIFVSSETHRSAPDFNFAEFGKYQEYTMAKTVSLYGYYKLMTNTFLQELSARLNTGGEVKVSVHSLCPGPVNSNIAREAPKIFHPLIKLIFGLFFSSPTKAAEPVLYLAAAPELEKKTDVYLHLMTQKSVDERAKNPEIRAQLWKESLKLLQGLKQKIH
ncbi:MAG: SDR family NAD(P)-dependent oxidoreductase [Microscillaceae bacterium]|nr:SDR family NAD(P)-dependent oxidoreductase [Microscillaceae bacterium]